MSVSQLLAQQRSAAPTSHSTAKLLKDEVDLNCFGY